MDAIGRLAGGVAHDFNNLLAAIQMYCDLLNDDSSKQEMVLENTREIRLVAERGAALTRQLLVFSRKQVVQYQSLNLNELINNLKKMLERLITEDIEIHSKLASSLGFIKADPGQIEQVLMNLVVNARDAMPQGGKITIETSSVLLDESFTDIHLTANRGQHVVLSVSDTGTGMDHETKARIFEPFFTTKAVGKGTGLGLTTVYGIVKQIQGTIWVYSEPEKGSIFKIYIPVSSPLDAVEEPRAIQEEPTKIETGTILLVEDEERLRSLFSESLRKRGFQVLVAENGIEALEHCKNYEGKIDLLLTDVVMPQMGGFELVQEIDLLRPGIRVLYMSGYANDSLGDQSNILNGAISFIQKPFDTNALVSKIQEMRRS